MSKTIEEGVRALAKAATRERVLTAARAAFELKGFVGVDMRTIARAAGLSTGAVFNNFTGKADLYAAAMGKPAPTVATMNASQDMLAALQDARAFVDRHSEPWYTSGQELLAQIDTAIAGAIK